MGRRRPEPSEHETCQGFLDVGLYESMAWARWGASKWVQNEPGCGRQHL